MFCALFKTAASTKSNEIVIKNYCNDNLVWKRGSSCTSWKFNRRWHVYKAQNWGYHTRKFYLCL